ncbi:S41 family peptidase [Cellvibrio polysaccharolyticus]|nr:S41 family peptidase [Cellvibrio polysaccharolyticus]
MLQLEPGKSLKPDQAFSASTDSIFLRKKQLSDDLWFGSPEDNKTVYVRFHRYPTIKNMESFADDLLKFINNNHSENLIIDLRDNHGGDFFVGLRLAQRLVLADSINWKSGVYVLINNVTFSAAMSNAAQFQQLLNAKLVGEPTGARPSGYQDMGSFTLPNSQLELTWSKRLYRFNDSQKDALYPDVTIKLSINDYINRKDPQLLWILNDIRSK